jgi:alkylation response protein AidB-like acyl-CoA dehydrogenase
MNLAFSEDQRFIQDQANNFLQAQCTPMQVREILESDQTFHQALWQQMVDLGWPALSIPESYGGLGLGFLELCLIAEELGKALAPVPFLSSVVLATEALKACNDENLKQTWLPALASGEAIGCVALKNSSALSVHDGKANGTLLPVFDGGVANFIIFANPDTAGNHLLFLADLTQTAAKITNLDSMDPSKNIAKIEFDQALVIPITVPNSVDEVINKLFNTAAVITAFEQFGGAEKAMNTGIEYTKNRYAFGRQVASFQAIKHKFADMFVALELAKSNAYYAAWALSSDAEELELAAATARVSGSDAYYDISKENIEVHGGMGFTWEFDCHLYYRRAQYLAAVIGTQPVWQDKLVDALIAHGIAA